MIKKDETCTFFKLKESDNYKEWAREMTFALRQIELMRLVNDDQIQSLLYMKEQKKTILEKNEEVRIEKREEVIEKWDINNEKMMSKIEAMCIRAVQMKFKSEWNAKTTWELLRKRYTSHEWVFKWALLNRLKETSYANSIDVSNFDRKMRFILKEIKNQEITIEEYVMIKIINFMSNEFDTYVTVLNESVRKKKALSELDKLLQSLKKKKNRMKSTITLAAMHSEREEHRDWDREGREDFDRFSFWKNNDSSTESYCNVCFYNHEKRQCHHDRMKCYECHKTEHVRRNCSKLRSSTSQSQDERKQIINMIRNTIAQVSSIENTKFVDWILNFECTTHICNNRFRFIDSTYKQHIKTVQIIIDQIVMFCDKESVEINLAVIEMKLLLKEVIHVLEMKHNYMSMNALSKRKLDVFFHHVQPRLMIDNNVMEYIDKLIDCYELYDIQEEEQKVMTFIKKSLDSAVWHGRTAHLNHRNMLKMRNLVKGMKELKTSSSPEKICGFCMTERQQAEISRSSMTRVIKILKLLHLNLKDSLSIVWIDDYSYFLLIKNDFSLLIFVYSLKLKSETHHKLIEFKTLMKKQINMKVKRLRVDEEDEFRDHKWENWCKKTEIKLKSSALYTSQQNEKTERSMYTLMTSVRSILKEKKLSKALWLELVKAVAYIKNRCSKIDEVIFFQTGNEFQSDVSNLWALECRAWVHVSKITDHHKLDSHFWQDIMIDYEEMNQWRIYSSVNRKFMFFETSNLTSWTSTIVSLTKN